MQSLPKVFIETVLVQFMVFIIAELTIENIGSAIRRCTVALGGATTTSTLEHIVTCLVLKFQINNACAVVGRLLVDTNSFHGALLALGYVAYMLGVFALKIAFRTRFAHRPAVNSSGVIV